jgi:hypothetical protein
MRYSDTFPAKITDFFQNYPQLILLKKFAKLLVFGGVRGTLFAGKFFSG